MVKRDVEKNGEVKVHPLQVVACLRQVFHLIPSSIQDSVADAIRYIEEQEERVSELIEEGAERVADIEAYKRELAAMSEAAANARHDACDMASEAALARRSSSAAQPVAQVMRAMANDGKCGPVVWFRSALEFPDGTNLYAGTPPSASAPNVEHVRNLMDYACQQLTAARSWMNDHIPFTECREDTERLKSCIKHNQQAENDMRQYLGAMDVSRAIQKEPK